MSHVSHFLMPAPSLEIDPLRPGYFADGSMRMSERAQLPSTDEPLPPAAPEPAPNIYWLVDWDCEINFVQRERDGQWFERHRVKGRMTKWAPTRDKDPDAKLCQVYRRVYLD